MILSGCRFGLVDGLRPYARRWVGLVDVLWQLTRCAVVRQVVVVMHFTVGRGELRLRVQWMRREKSGRSAPLE